MPLRCHATKQLTQTNHTESAYICIKIKQYKERDQEMNKITNADITANSHYRKE